MNATVRVEPVELVFGKMRAARSRLQAASASFQFRAMRALAALYLGMFSYKSLSGCPPKNLALSLQS
jgi:hypothetical protein